MAGDNDTAAAGGLSLVDPVLGVQAGLVAGVDQDICVLVLSDAADVQHGFGGKDVLDKVLATESMRKIEYEISGPHLSTTGSVLGSTTSDQFRIAVLDEVFVEAHVLLFGEDGIVGFYAVFLEHRLISTSALANATWTVQVK
jgi:hypothetical protein